MMAPPLKYAEKIIPIIVIIGQSRVVSVNSLVEMTNSLNTFGVLLQDFRKPFKGRVISQSNAITSF